MVFTEFIENVEKMQRFYEKEYNEMQKQEMFRYFSKYNDKRFKYIISKVYQKNKFLPSLAELIEIDQNIPYTEIQKQELKLEKKENCKICKNNGFIAYTKEIEGTKYQYIASCNCSNSINFQYDGMKCKDLRNRSAFYIPKYSDILHV